MSLRVQPSGAMSRFSGKRTESRVRVAVEAKIETIHGRISAYVLDISCHGAMIQTTQPLVRGHQLVLRVGPVDVLGTIAWVHQDRFGLEFDEPVGEEHVIELRHLADEAAWDRLHRCTGRPALRTRTLTPEEWKVTEQWAVSNSWR